LLGGIPPIQESSKSTLMVPILDLQQQGIFWLGDWTRMVLKIGATNYGHTSSLVAEACELKDGVFLAVRAGYTKINNEGDNLLVIQALKGINRVPWQITSILEDIHAWIK